MQVDCKLRADLLAMQVQAKYAIQKQKSQPQETKKCHSKTVPEGQTVCAMGKSHQSMGWIDAAKDACTVVVLNNLQHVAYLHAGLKWWQHTDLLCPRS